MTRNKIASLLARLDMCLTLCVFSCEKPANTLVIDKPNLKPQTGTGTGTGNGNGSGSGSGNGSGTGTGTGTGTGSGEESGTLCKDIGQTPIVLAYFTEYTETLPEVTLLTHINYAHGRFKNPKTGDGGIVITESSKAPLSKVVALKSVNPNLKVMLMIGGWGGHADGFSEMAKSDAKRTEFCNSVKSLLEKHKLDGVDIDWEYPTQSADGETGCDPMDTQNFNLVLRELRETLGTGKIISFASKSDAKYVDWKTAIKYLDYVNVMTYDMGAAPNGHNSPLHKSNRFTHRSWDEAIDAHVKAGVPKNRQVMGVPFYGKAEKNPNEGTKIFEYSVKYYEIPDILNKGTYKGKALARAVHRQWDATAMVPFLVDDAGKNVLSYDDPESVAAKGAYVKANGMLGAMFWEYRCDTDDHALLKPLVNAIYGKESVLQ
jgi:chitinase